MKILLVLIPFFILSCSSSKVQMKEYTDTAVTCYQTEDQSGTHEHECAKINDNRELYRWHQMKSWETMGEMPDIDQD